MPMAGAYGIVSGGSSRTLTAEEINDISRVAAVAAWRPTRTIVEIEEERLRRLWKGTLPQKVQAADLTSLPAWGLYVDLSSIEETPAGAIVHLEHDANDGHAELRALLIEEDLSTEPALLDLKGPVDESARSVIEEAVRASEESGRRLPIELGITDRLTERIRPYLSIGLYLASDKSEWTPRRPTRPDRRPRDAAPSDSRFFVS
jgi:hypothetical protein